MNKVVLEKEGVIKGEYSLDKEDFNYILHMIQNSHKRYKKLYINEKFPLKRMILPEDQKIVDSIKAELDKNAEKVDKILVIDIDFILPEHKDLSFEEMENMFSKKYGCKVLLIDSSRVNTRGNTKEHPPVYFA